jgi:hypothetical protein
MKDIIMCICLLGVDDAAIYDWPGTREALQLELGRNALLAIEAGNGGDEMFGTGALQVQLVDVAADDAKGGVCVWVWSSSDAIYVSKLTEQEAQVLRSLIPVPEIGPTHT